MGESLYCVLRDLIYFAVVLKDLKKLEACLSRGGID